MRTISSRSLNFHVVDVYPDTDLRRDPATPRRILTTPDLDYRPVPRKPCPSKEERLRLHAEEMKRVAKQARLAALWAGRDRWSATPEARALNAAIMAKVRRPGRLRDSAGRYT